MQLVNDVVHTGPLQMMRTGFDRLWDWAIYQLHRGWTFLAKKLQRPYELAKWLAFWAVVLIAGMWVLYYISMGLYLSFYFLILRPPSVPTLLQPLNLRYPDPGTADYIYAYHCIAPVTYPQTYNWKLSLEMPENPTNFDAGVFMVSLALYPPDELPTQPQQQVRDMFYRHLQGNVGNPSIELQKTGDKIRIGSRPLMLRWRPDIYRWIQTIVFAIPRIASDIVGFGWFEENQHLEVNMIERHETTLNSTYYTKQCFVVSINNPKVQIYKATIESTVLLEGWRYLLYSWFWTCFFIGSFLIFCGLITAVTLYWSIVLISAVLKGELKFPKLWLTDEEQQMKDMKEAVASLMHQKRLETTSRGSTDSIGHLQSKSPREKRKTSRTTEEDSLFGPSSKTGAPENTERPKSWLDEPFDYQQYGIDDNEQLTAIKKETHPKPPQKAEPVFNADWEPHRRSLAASSSSMSDSNTEEWPARRNRFERDGEPNSSSASHSIVSKSDPHQHLSSAASSSQSIKPEPEESSTHLTAHRTMFADLIAESPSSSHQPASESETKAAVASIGADSEDETSEEPPVGLADLLSVSPAPIPPSTPQPASDDDNELQ